MLSLREEASKTGTEGSTFWASRRKVASAESVGAVVRTKNATIRAVDLTNGDVEIGSGCVGEPEDLGVLDDTHDGEPVSSLELGDEEIPVGMKSGTENSSFTIITGCALASSCKLKSRP